MDALGQTLERPVGDRRDALDALAEHDGRTIVVIDHVERLRLLDTWLHQRHPIDPTRTLRLFAREVLPHRTRASHPTAVSDTRAHREFERTPGQSSNHLCPGRDPSVWSTARLTHASPGRSMGVTPGARDGWTSSKAQARRSGVHSGRA